MLTFEQAVAQKGSYKPLDEHFDHLAGVSMACFVGPTASGKNYLINESGFAVSINDTTRASRDDDPEGAYEYFTNEEYLRLIENRQVAQYTPFPGTNTLYGTRPESYRSGDLYARDTLPESVNDFVQIFGKTICIYVARPVNEWRDAFVNRARELKPASVNARLAEAERSLAWALLEPKAFSFMFICNRKDNTESNVAAIKEFAKSEEANNDQVAAIKCCQAMLAALPSIRRELLAA